jgi:hypothetical protein
LRFILAPSTDFPAHIAVLILGVIALTNAIPDMDISKFTFSGSWWGGTSKFSKPVTMETTMTVADFSEKGLGVSGAIMLSAFLPKCT